jgi:hypothetical protein
MLMTARTDVFLMVVITGVALKNERTWGAVRMWRLGRRG